MYNPKFHTHEQTVALYEKAREADQLMQRGKEHPDKIFFSKFNPLFKAPELPEPVKAEEDEREYKSRSPYGIKALQAAVEKSLRKADIGFKPTMGSGNHHCFVCGTSVNSTLLPNLFNVRHAEKGLFKLGDEVLVCSPIYGLLPLKAHDAGLKIIDIPGNRENRYKPQAEAIAETLQQHPNARAIMIVNPANPTGAALTKEEIEKIGAVVAGHNRGKDDDHKLIIVTDETFKNLQWPTFTGPCWPPHILKVMPPELQNGWSARNTASFLDCRAVRDCTISLNSFSKAYAPGKGFAYAIAHPDLIARMPTSDGPALEAQEYAAGILGDNPKNKEALQQHLDESVCRYHAQYVMLEDMMRAINEKLKKKFRQDKEYITLAGEPDAGFHVAVCFPGLKGLRLDGAFPQIGTIHNSLDLATHLSGSVQVTAYPGEMFYMNGEDMMLRFSLNLDQKKFHEALDRVEKFCMKLEQSRAATIKSEAANRAAGPGSPG